MEQNNDFTYWNDEWNNVIMNQPIGILETIYEDKTIKETFYPKYSKIEIIKNK